MSVDDCRLMVDVEARNAVAAMVQHLLSAFKFPARPRRPLDPPGGAPDAPLMLGAHLHFWVIASMSRCDPSAAADITCRRAKPSPGLILHVTCYRALNCKVPAQGGWQELCQSEPWFSASMS